MIYLYGNETDVANFVRDRDYGAKTWSRVIDPSELDGAPVGSIIIPVNCELPVDYARAAHAYRVTIVTNVTMIGGRREGKSSKLREAMKEAQEQLKKHRETQENSSPPPLKRLLVGVSHEVDYFTNGMQWNDKDFNHVSSAAGFIGWPTGTQVVFLGSWRRTYYGTELWDVAHEPARGFKCIEIKSIDDYLKTFGPKIIPKMHQEQESQEHKTQEYETQQVHDAVWAYEQCLASLNASLEEAGDVRIDTRIKAMTAEELLRHIAPFGIRFTQLPWATVEPQDRPF